MKRSTLFVAVVLVVGLYMVNQDLLQLSIPSNIKIGYSHVRHQPCIRVLHDPRYPYIIYFDNRTEMYAWIDLYEPYVSPSPSPSPVEEEEPEEIVEEVEENDIEFDVVTVDSTFQTKLLLSAGLAVLAVLFVWRNERKK